MKINKNLIHNNDYNINRINKRTETNFLTDKNALFIYPEQ